MKQKRINLKVKPLCKNLISFFDYEITTNHPTRYKEKETSPVYFKENYYLLENDKCWFEIKHNGVFRAFKYDKKDFLMDLKEHEPLKYRKRVIDLIHELMKIEPSIFKHNPTKLVQDYIIEKNIIKYRREGVEKYVLRWHKENNLKHERKR